MSIDVKDAGGVTRTIAYTAADLWNKMEEVRGLLADVNPAAVSSLSKRSVAQTVTRPADTLVYAINDLIAGSISFGSVVPITFPNMGRVNGGTGTLLEARITSSAIRAGTDTIRLDIFKNLPVFTAGGDNATLTTGMDGLAAIHIGGFDVTLSSVYGTGMDGSAPPRGRSGIIYECATAGTSLFGLLSAGSVFTPTSGEVFNAVLGFVQD